MNKTLKAVAVGVGSHSLRNGRRFLLVDLDISYLSVLQFQAPLKANRPTKPRKRKKRGLPVDEILEMQTWIGSDGESLQQVDAELALSRPLDSHASISIEENDSTEIQEGSIVELRIVSVNIGDNLYMAFPVKSAHW